MAIHIELPEPQVKISAQSHVPGECFIYNNNIYIVVDPHNIDSLCMGDVAFKESNNIICLNFNDQQFESFVPTTLVLSVDISLKATYE